MQCALCQGRVSEVMDFGDVALAGAFLTPEDFATERKHRLRLAYCESCLLLQVPDRVDSSTLFRDYFYFSSATETMRRHFNLLAMEIAEMRPQSVVEIGCNDGVLLKPLAERGVDVVGVDPARNVVATIADDRIEVINEFFGPGVVSGKADVVVANNVFAHMPDIHGVTRAISDLLTNDGVFIFEVNRLDSMIADLQYDWVYHEHLFYFSLLALEKHFKNHGMEIFDCKKLGTHAGSMRYYAAKAGSRLKTKAVRIQMEIEIGRGLNKVERFELFERRASEHRLQMRSLVSEYRSVAGYGACGRANTMLQFCGFGKEDIQYIVDDAPAKHGYYTPGSHIPVVSRDSLISKPEPDCLIVFAWSFMNEIRAKLLGYAGKVFVPLPHIYEHKRSGWAEMDGIGQWRVA